MPSLFSLESSLLIFGAGEHACCIADDLANDPCTIPCSSIAVVVDSPASVYHELDPVVRVIDQQKLFSKKPDFTGSKFIIGFASSSSLIHRDHLFSKIITELDIKPFTHISPTVLLGHYTRVDAGTYIARGCIVNSRSTIGKNCVLFAGVVIEHDCQIGSGVIIGPGAIICGGVTIEDFSFIGAGACISDHTVIPALSFVKANSTVSRNDTSALRPLRHC